MWSWKFKIVEWVFHFSYIFVISMFSVDRVLQLYNITEQYKTSMNCSASSLVQINLVQQEREMLQPISFLLSNGVKANQSL